MYFDKHHMRFVNACHLLKQLPRLPAMTPPHDATESKPRAMDHPHGQELAKPGEPNAGNSRTQCCPIFAEPLATIA